MVSAGVYAFVNAMISDASPPLSGPNEAAPSPMTDVIQVPFETIYSDTCDAVFRFCLSQLRNRALAEDVAADVFASAWSAYPEARLADLAAARSWIFRIARNATVDQHRRHVTRRGLMARLRRNSPPDASVETLAGVRDDLRRVVHAISQLPARDRTLVGLRIAAALPYADVARVMGMSEDAVKVATNRALIKVRLAVEVSGIAARSSVTS